MGKTAAATNLALPGGTLKPSRTAVCLLCSGRTLTREAGAGRMLCLTGCAIPAPVVMTLGAPALLDCHVSTATGEVQLRSTSQRSKAVQLHFRATMGSIPAQALLAPQQGSEQQPASGTDSSLESSTLEAAAERGSAERRS